MKKILNILKRIIKFFYKNKQDKIFIKWFKDEGDRILRQEYKNISSESIIFDVGG